MRPSFVKPDIQNLMSAMNVQPLPVEALGRQVQTSGSLPPLPPRPMDFPAAFPIEQEIPVAQPVSYNRPIRQEVNEAIGITPQAPQTNILEALQARLKPTLRDISSAAVASVIGDKYVSPEDVVGQRIEQLKMIESLTGNMRATSTLGKILTDPTLPPDLRQQAVDAYMARGRTDGPYGKPPVGYKYTENKSGFEPVSGGPADPSVKPKQASPAERALANQGAKRLSELQSDTDVAQNIINQGDAFLEAQKGVSLQGPGLGWLPNVSSGAAAAETAGRELQLTFTEKTKGAISDREMAMFANASPNLDKTDEQNAAIIHNMKAAANRTFERSAFYAEFFNIKGDLIGADMAWKKYIDENPIFDVNKRIDQQIARNPRRDEWVRYLPQGGQNFNQTFDAGNEPPLNRNQSGWSAEEIQ